MGQSSRDMKSSLSCIHFLRQNAIALPLLVLCGYIVAESYQIDFRAFYVAGKSVLLGLDPYLNPVDKYPELYAAINAEANPYSAFRYPPIAAIACVPLALLPYAVSRIAFAIATFTVAMAVGWWALRSHESDDRVRLTLTIALVSLPVQATFQRGQADLILVLLSLLAFGSWTKKPHATSGPALLASAAALKVFPGILIIYFAIKNQPRFLWQFAAWTAGLFAIPFPLLGLEAYKNFARRSLPEIFGSIKANTPLELSGQNTVFFGSANYVDAIEGRGMVASRDFVGGAMNPLLFNHSLLAILLGLTATAAIVLVLRKESPSYQFLAILNVINLANPLSWLMGLVWYLPFFFRHFPAAKTSQRLILLAPLFLPPALGLNGYAAIVVPLIPGIRLLDAERDTEDLHEQQGNNESKQHVHHQ